jgi:hypothetical protein
MRWALWALSLYSLTAQRLGSHLYFTIATGNVRKRNKGCGQLQQTVHFLEIRVGPITYVTYKN